MYPETLLLHTWLRWAVILTGVFALVRGVAGWPGTRAWNRTDDRSGLFFIIALDLQTLVGLLLYFLLSPITAQARENFGEAMRDPNLRYWAVEHILGMFIALVLAHVGRVRVRKAAAARKHRTAAIFFGLALIAILVSIPWPGMTNGRPLWWW
jgi:hypothetical protein